MPAGKVVKIPSGIDSQQAAAMMLQGMTVEYLLRRAYPVRSGETILFHAAAGGVGLIACQWAKHLGATVIGTVGNEDKAERARAHGCDHPIVYTRENFTERVRELTEGAGVPVVYDSVGRDTFEGSLDCLRPRGMLVSFGQSSGKIAPVDLGILSTKGSLYVTRPTLMTYTASRADLEASSEALFDVVGRGAVRVTVSPDVPPRRGVRRTSGPRIETDHGLDHPAAMRPGKTVAAGPAAGGLMAVPRIRASSRSRFRRGRDPGLGRAGHVNRIRTPTGTWTAWARGAGSFMSREGKRCPVQC